MKEFTNCCARVLNDIGESFFGVVHNRRVNLYKAAFPNTGVSRNNQLESGFVILINHLGICCSVIYEFLNKILKEIIIIAFICTKLQNKIGISCDEYSKLKFFRKKCGKMI